MRRIDRATVLALVLAMVGFPLSGCLRRTEAAARIEPAEVEHSEGTDFSHVLLIESAVARIGLETTPVRQAAASGEPGDTTALLEIPYASVIYGVNGETWVYVSPEPLTYVRQPVTIEAIEADVALLSDGPPVGTQVVLTGAAELYGTEFGIDH